MTGWSVFILSRWCSPEVSSPEPTLAVTEVYDEENTEAKEDAAEEAAEKEAERTRRRLSAKRRKEPGRTGPGGHEDDVDHLLPQPESGGSVSAAEAVPSDNRHRFFGPFGGCIAVNTLVLAMEHARMPSSHAKGSDVVNPTDTCLLEMVTKVIGMGFEEYAKDRFNCSTRRWS